MLEIYKRVAELFSAKIDSLFESEATLEAEFKKNFEQLPFDRTDHWSGLIYKMLRDAWLEAGPEVKVEPTAYDAFTILRFAYSLLDYNLFTQALLNLQGYSGMHYMTGDAEKQIEKLKESWTATYSASKLDPFAQKARMVKNAAAADETAYNDILSTMRSLRIISQFTPHISFRVSPKGSTPAFADSRNVSMIGMGGDKYLRTLPTLAPYYITWAQAPAMATTIGVEDGHAILEARDIPYKFKSKSGGEILHEVLFARKLMYEIFGGIDVTKETCIMVPRMSSLLIVTAKYGESLRKVFDRLKGQFPMLELHEGSRTFGVPVQQIT